MARYSLLRILLFFGVMAVLYLVGLREPFLLILASAFGSMVISFFALSRFREDAAEQLATRMANRSSERRARGGTDEDDEDREAYGDRD